MPRKRAAMPAGPSDVMWHVSQLCTLIGTFSPQQRPVTLSATLSLQSFDFFSFSLRFPSSSHHFLSLHSVAASSVCLCFVIFVDWLAPALRWKLPMVIYLFLQPSCSLSSFLLLILLFSQLPFSCFSQLHAELLF